MRRSEKQVQLEQKIKESTLFSLDPKTKPIAYEREKMKLLKDLYTYMFTYKKYRDYNVEVFETAIRCIENYDAEKGEFLQYAHSSIKKACQIANAKKRLTEEFSGIYITSRERMVIAKIRKYFQIPLYGEFKKKKIKKIAIQFGLREEVVEKYIAEYERKLVMSDVVYGEDGSLFDCIPDKTMPYNAILEHEDVRELMDCIDEVFLERQSRQQSLFSQLLTMKIVEILQEDTQLLEEAQAYSFFDEKMYGECVESKKIPKAKEIAKRFDVSEQSLSRTKRKFETHLAEKLEKRK